MSAYTLQTSEHLLTCQRVHVLSFADDVDLELQLRDEGSCASAMLLHEIHQGTVEVVTKVDKGRQTDFSADRSHPFPG